MGPGTTSKPRTQIQGGTTQVQQPAPVALQPATNVMNYPSSGGGGGTLAATTNEPAYVAPRDPWLDSPWGSQAAYNQAVYDIDSGLGNIRTAGAEAFGALAPTLRGQAEGLYNRVRTGQRNIDRSRANVERNRMSGIQDILGYVRGGLRQGASRLATMNATDSSAAGALAQAYSQIGNQRTRGVNNQAGIQNTELDTGQEDLNLQRTQGQTDFRRMRDSEVNRIGSEIRSQLAALDREARSMSLPDRVAIDQERQNIINAGQAQLSEVDNWLNSQLGTVNPMNREQVVGSANEMARAGQALENPFAVEGIQQSMVGTPAIDQLPLFVRRRQFA